MFTISEDGWLLKDDKKVPTELVLIERDREAGSAYLRNPQAIENLTTINLFLYNCMVSHSSLRTRRE